MHFKFLPSVWSGLSLIYTSRVPGQDNVHCACAVCVLIQNRDDWVGWGHYRVRETVIQMADSKWSCMRTLIHLTEDQGESGSNAEFTNNVVGCPAGHTFQRENTIFFTECHWMTSSDRSAGHEEPWRASFSCSSKCQVYSQEDVVLKAGSQK